MNSRRVPFDFHRACALYQQFERDGGYARQEALKRAYRERLDAIRREAVRNVVIFVCETPTRSLLRAS